MRVADIPPEGAELSKANKRALLAPDAELLASLAEPDTEPSRERNSDWEQSKALFGALVKSKASRGIGLFAGGIVLFLMGNMAGQVWLNAWNGQFFDAVGRKDGAAIWQHLVTFAWIVAFLLTMVVAQTWLHETVKIKIRAWLTDELLDHWLVPARAYRLGLSGDLGANPDQRMQEDARNLSELSADLGVGLLQAVMQLVCFVGVLWSLSSSFAFTISGVHVDIPGYMVWCALAYALIGSGLTWFVGSPLVALNTTTYQREAQLRFAMVRASESSESIALFGGEADERRSIDDTLSATLAMRRRVANATAKLTWITSGYGWLALVVPIIVALPAYLQSGLTLGGLMMVVGAFAQVQASLRWFVDNFAKIADWRAALRRVSSFHDALLTLDDATRTDETITMLEHPEGHLVFENLSIHLADGSVIINEATAEIKPGERVLLTGESGSGKSTLFRAVAGIWPWGTGRILGPKRSDMMFLPQRPYLPLGSLNEALCYPSGPSAFTLAEVLDVMEDIGLGDFVDQLDRRERWDQQLSLGQQQRVAFARLLLHKPAWIFLDEATSALDRESQTHVMSLITRKLPASGILSIAHRRGLEEFHSRTIHLSVTKDGAKLARAPRAGSNVSNATYWDRLASWTSHLRNKSP
ncbi:MAG: ABC transporter ATP-binding protein/permease [Hyphomicrobiaceae bacterium]